MFFIRVHSVKFKQIQFRADQIKRYSSSIWPPDRWWHVGALGLFFDTVKIISLAPNKLTSWSLTQSYSSVWLWLRYSLTIQITTDLRGLFHNACWVTGQIVWRWSINNTDRHAAIEISSSSSYIFKPWSGGSYKLLMRETNGNWVIKANQCFSHCSAPNNNILQ